MAQEPETLPSSGRAAIAAAGWASWGGRLVFVYLPEISRFTRTRTPSIYRDRVLATARQAGIVTVDVVDSFAAHPDPPSLWQGANAYNHFTPEGNAIVSSPDK